MHRQASPINPRFEREATRAEFKEGPYTVVMHRMDGFRRFTCKVGTTEILRQASCPGREELNNALWRAHERGEVPRWLTVRMAGERDHG
ncbi:MAG: hypothetical protein FJ399_08620 [Verrucomicrobia bacterium]|nr:hypothetical protein [Verrucomicrobiota bacterium]